MNNCKQPHVGEMDASRGNVKSDAKDLTLDQPGNEASLLCENVNCLKLSTTAY